MDENTRSSSALKSPWVWGWFGMIVVVMAANMTMIHFARTTSPGLVVNDFYEKGKNYDNTLQKRQLEKSLGWQISPQLPEKIKVDKTFPIAISVAGANDETVLPREATIYVFRPSDATADFSLPMELSKKGMFVADLELPLPGKWDIIFSLSSGDEHKEISYKVFVEK